MSAAVIDQSAPKKSRYRAGSRARVDLIAAIDTCEKAQDFVSRNMVREILDETEEHIDYLETQIGLLKSLGEQNYLQSAMGELPDS